MNRRIRRFQSRVNDMMYLVNQEFDSKADYRRAVQHLRRLEALLSWLIDDHRARLARYATNRCTDANPQFSHFMANFEIDPISVCWVDGTPSTHNASLQAWRNHYLHPAGPTASPGIALLIGATGMAKSQFRPAIKDNLTYSR